MRFGRWAWLVGWSGAWLVACGARDACPAGQRDCQGACVDLTTSAASCGSCGNACAAGEVCSLGQCSPSCGGGTSNCGGSCVDIRSNPSHCGACGKVCAAGLSCSQGSCALSCAGGTSKCGASCVDTHVDPAHCGACDSACAPGEVCSQGKCALSCAGGTSKCGASCVDTQTNPSHCGNCDTSCFGGLGVCVAGQCKPASCGDGVQNGSESDVDCGGICAKCADGKACKLPDDCKSALCDMKACKAAGCKDGLKNGTETDLDCGGSCDPCAVGKSCGGGLDCESAVCTNKKCVAPSCGDGVKNGGETNVDCGGPCPLCTVLTLHFDEGAGASAKDASPSGNDGVVTGNPNWVTGKMGKALFTDKQSHVEVSDAASLDLPNGMTLSLWVTAASAATYASPLMKTTNGAWKDGYGMYLDNGLLCAYVSEWSMYRACAPFAATAQFRHVAASYDGAVLRLYLDGVEKATFATAIGISDTMTTLNLGDANANGSYVWDGAIDELRIYDFALSAKQIAALAQLSNP